MWSDLETVISHIRPVRIKVPGFENLQVKITTSRNRISPTIVGDLQRESKTMTKKKYCIHLQLSPDNYRGLLNKVLTCVVCIRSMATQEENQTLITLYFEIDRLIVMRIQKLMCHIVTQ